MSLPPLTILVFYPFLGVRLCQECPRGKALGPGRSRDSGESGPSERWSADQIPTRKFLARRARQRRGLECEWRCGPRKQGHFTITASRKDVFSAQRLQGIEALVHYFSKKYLLCSCNSGISGPKQAWFFSL